MIIITFLFTYIPPLISFGIRICSYFTMSVLIPAYYLFFVIAYYENYIQTFKMQLDIWQLIFSKFLQCKESITKKWTMG